MSSVSRRAIDPNARNILMVYPETPTTYWSYRHALAFVGKKAVNPPLGLMTVAALLPSDFQVRLVDMNVEPLLSCDVESADMVFLSSMLVQQKSFKQVVTLCNALGTPVVAGGPYAMSSHQQITGVDAFVLGEAELTLPPFLEDLAAGTVKPVYESPGLADITQSPPPRYDLIDMAAYDTMALQYSRGCPYACEFCDIIEMFGRVQRAKSPQQFLSELDVLHAAGHRGSVFIVDDNFIGNRKKTRDLLRAISSWQKDRGYPFIFSTEASIDLAQDPELLTLMTSAAFSMVFVGIETPDRETLAFTGKRQNLKREIHESVETIQRYGIEVAGGFIVGFDTDQEDIFGRQMEFIQTAAIPTAMVGLLMALPGTELERRLASEGRLRSTVSGNNTHQTELSFEPMMDENTLLSGYKTLLSEVYRPRFYFERCRRLLRRMPARPNGRGPFSWAKVRALLRSIRVQSFSRYGLSYLKLIFGSLIRRPRRFADAVTMAIKGYHFFAITEEIRSAAALNELIETNIRSLSLRLKAFLESSEHTRRLRRSIRRISVQVERRYRRLGVETRETVRDAYAQFQNLCGQCLMAVQR